MSNNCFRSVHKLIRVAILFNNAINSTTYSKIVDIYSKHTFRHLITHNRIFRFAPMYQRFRDKVTLPCTSSLVTTTGPRGQNSSIAFPSSTCPPFFCLFCQSLALTSSATQKPKIKSIAWSFYVIKYSVNIRI